MLEELSKISLVEVVLPTSSGVEIRKRCVTRPTEHQETLSRYLGVRLPRQVKKCPAFVSKIIFENNVVKIFDNRSRKNKLQERLVVELGLTLSPGVPGEREKSEEAITFVKSAKARIDSSSLLSKTTQTD